MLISVTEEPNSELFSECLLLNRHGPYINYFISNSCVVVFLHLKDFWDGLWCIGRLFDHAKTFLIRSCNYILFLCPDISLMVLYVLGVCPVSGPDITRYITQLWRISHHSRLARHGSSLLLLQQVRTTNNTPS